MFRLLVTVMVVCALALPTRFASAETPAPKNRTTALALSLGGTLVSLGLTAAGAGSQDGVLLATGLVSSLVTPSAGEIYAGELFTAGMGIRLLSAGVGYVGVGVALRCFLVTRPCEKHDGLAVSLITAGAAGYVSGIVYDIATAGAAVDRHNRRIELQLAPIIPTPANRAAGLSLRGSF